MVDPRVMQCTACKHDVETNADASVSGATYVCAKCEAVRRRARRALQLAARAYAGALEAFIKADGRQPHADERELALAQADEALARTAEEWASAKGGK